MNESTSLISTVDGKSSDMKYNAIVTEEHVQPAEKDYFKPSRPISAIKFDYEAVYLPPTSSTTSAHDIDDDQDDVEQEEFLAKVIRILDLTAEGQERLLYWGLLLVLIALTSIERVSFKMVIDNMTPYRLVVEVCMSAGLAISYGIIVAVKYYRSVLQLPSITSIPPFQLLTMATLDTIQFSGLVIAAAGISPTMTLILLHASTPGTVLGSKILFSQRSYSFRQDRGVHLILFSIILSIIQPMFYYLIDHRSLNLVNSSIIYTMSATVQGIAMVYKEYTLPMWSTAPLDIHFLSMCLFASQTMLTIISSPFIYTLQDLTREGIGFPIISFERNLRDGMMCLFGEYPYPATHHNHIPYDYKYATCQDINIWLVIGYIVSNIAIIECVDLILKKRQNLLCRSMIVGVFVAFIALTVYDTKAYYGVGLYGSNVGVVDIVALMVLIVGMEIYGRRNEITVDSNNYNNINIVDRHEPWPMHVNPTVHVDQERGPIILVQQ